MLWLCQSNSQLMRTIIVMKKCAWAYRDIPKLWAVDMDCCWHAYIDLIFMFLIFLIIWFLHIFNFNESLVYWELSICERHEVSLVAVCTRSVNLFDFFIECNNFAEIKHLVLVFIGLVVSKQRQILLLRLLKHRVGPLNQDSSPVLSHLLNGIQVNLVVVLSECKNLLFFEKVHVFDLGTRNLKQQSLLHEVVHMYGSGHH